jgi:hypothetical protein
MRISYKYLKLKMRKILYFILLSYVLVSCSNTEPLKPEEIYKKYERSVVLIRHDYYYTLELKDGTIIYFSSIENNEFINFTFDENEVIPNTITGTGFFVSKDGLIATNNHIAYPLPSSDDYDVYELLKVYFQNNPDVYIYINNYLVDQIDEYDKLLESGETTESDYNLYIKERKTLYDSYLFWADLDKNGFIFNENNIEFNMVSSKLGIAYNNTYAEDISDFKDCVKKDVDNENNNDLALIQLKDKSTPSFVKNIFHFDETQGNNLKINSKIYMIGFNNGTEIGSTEDGLKNQLTQGTVSQEPDKNQVLYSIPTLPGSSGSPIINEWGNLVAINFAGYSNTQNFNYGVLSKHLKTMINKVNN